ncbi:MAG: hypothetical protein M0P49_03625 [Bacilli bacterium]|nr:hypothetical protein [Bacilli bacterium]
MFRNILILMLNRQLRVWEDNLKSSELDYDCVCLTPIQKEEVLVIKNTFPKKIKLIKDLIEEIL